MLPLSSASLKSLRLKVPWTRVIKSVSRSYRPKYSLGLYAMELAGTATCVVIATSPSPQTLVRLLRAGGGAAWRFSHEFVKRPGKWSG